MIDVREHVYRDDPRIGHPDVRTRLRGVAYFFLGNGRIRAAVQSAPCGEGTPLGVILMPAERLGKKREALSLDEDTGLESTRLVIRHGTRVGAASAGGVRAEWADLDGVPAVRAAWSWESYQVEELFFCPDRERARLLRRIRIRNGASGIQRPRIQTGLPGRIISRVLTLPPGERVDLAVRYEIRADEAAVEFCPPGDAGVEPGAVEFSRRGSWARLGSGMLDRLFGVAAGQLPAVISREGRVDASIWQYGREWVRDHAWMATGLLLCGHADMARGMLDRLLREFVTPDGAPVDSGRLRHPDEVELDQNGALLWTLDQLTRWTGDGSLVEKWWDRVVALAEFPLRPNFRGGGSDLLMNVRDYWERHAAHGIERGAELAHQLFVVIGLEAAARLAGLLRRHECEDRWSRQAARLRRAVLDESGRGLVEKGRLIKRRGENGIHQDRISARPGCGLPPGSPLGKPGSHSLEPDTVVVLPAAFGFISPESPLARNSLAAVEPLWNQTWEGGGYGRYAAGSEPDAPGGWPFPSLFVARAALECGRYDLVRRVIEWLDGRPEAVSGSWFEFNGRSHSPPFPQIGIPPWTWTEILLLLVHHMLGVRPGHDLLTVRPRLLPGLREGEAEFPLRGVRMRLRFRTGGGPAFKLDGKVLPAEGGAVSLPYPEQDFTLEAELPG